LFNTSFICSSIPTYSKPFCKNVTNAPGGISVCDTLDFVIKDSCANVNAACEKPNKNKRKYDNKYK
jgi:hypothetical protein